MLRLSNGNGKLLNAKWQQACKDAVGIRGKHASGSLA